MQTKWNTFNHNKFNSSKCPPFQKHNFRLLIQLIEDTRWILSSLIIIFEIGCWKKCIYFQCTNDVHHFFDILRTLCDCTISRYFVAITYFTFYGKKFCISRLLKSLRHDSLYHIESCIINDGTTAGIFFNFFFNIDIIVPRNRTARWLYEWLMCQSSVPKSE